MKFAGLLFVLANLVTFSANATDVDVVIKVGGSYEGYTNASQDRKIEILEKRVRDLERAMAQVQRDNYQVVVVTEPSGPKFSCSINWPQFVEGKGSTKHEAVTNLQRNCGQQNVSSIHCDESDASCGPI